MSLTSFKQCRRQRLLARTRLGKRTAASRTDFNHHKYMEFKFVKARNGEVFTTSVKGMRASKT